MKKISLVLVGFLMFFMTQVEATTIDTKDLDHLRENYLTLAEVDQIQTDGKVIGLEDETVFTVTHYVVEVEGEEVKYPVFLLGSNDELLAVESMKFMYGQTPIFTKGGVLHLNKDEVSKLNEDGKVYINYELVQTENFEIVKEKSEQGNYMAKFDLGSQSYSVPVDVTGGVNPLFIGFGAVVLGAVAALVVKKARG